jgi:hypothetical protein
VKHAIVILLAAGSLAPLSARPVPSANEPPSSFQPTKASAEVTFTHEHVRVVACVSQAGKECRPKKQPADGATVLRLWAVQPPTTTGSRLTPEPIVVDFDGGVGRQTRRVRLAAGDWTLEWPDSPIDQGLRVRNEEPFSVHLLTTTGSCEQTGPQCRLKPGRRREVTIPEMYRRR